MLAAAPLLLAGLLPLDSKVESRWTWAGAWYYPVGDSFAIGGTPPAGWQVTRNVKDGGHQGADLSFRRGGDPVRAAANGIVILAGTGEDPRGFGVHVVIAHRAGDGRLCYSVYAHLARKSVAVERGDAVAAGQTIGRVGATGRATSPHLHFEIRQPATPDQRWEKADVVDPIAFVGARLPAARSDTTDARPWRLWAETSGLLPAGDAVLARGEWWCALAAAVVLDGENLADDPAGARERLIAAGVRIATPDGDATRPVSWADVMADVKAVPDRLWRLPVAPRPRETHDDEPWTAARSETPPTRADICRLLASRAEDPEQD